MKYITIILVALFAIANGASVNNDLEPYVIDTVKDWFKDLAGKFTESVTPTIDEIIKSWSLIAAQKLAEISENGIGKRDDAEAQMYIKNKIKDSFKEIFDQVLFPAINNQAKNLALLAAQLLAGISETGVTGVKDLVGKRAVKDWFKDLADKFTETVTPTIDEIIKSWSLIAAQKLAEISENGIGKRNDAEAQLYIINKIKDSLQSSFKEIFDQVLFPAINNQAKNLALLAAQLLAGISETGITGVKDLVGKRQTDFFSVFGKQLADALLPKIDIAVKSLALAAAKALAGISETGIGK